MNEFCIFIISNGRPDNIITLDTLLSAGSNAPKYIVIDTEDKTKDDYIRKYKDMVLMFDKSAYASKVDNFDNTRNFRSTTHARNACFDMALELGYSRFLVLDDDYTEFKLRIKRGLIHPEGRYKIKKNIDSMFSDTFKFLDKTGAVSICYSQGGDWFGGGNNFNKKPKRKAMNSFFCRTDRRFWFFSRLNEDVNTYMVLGHKGSVFLTIPFVQLDQIQTQANKGGMSDAYLSGGTYVKSFYTVMCRPDCTKINKMGRTNKRLHHLINWKHAVPCIVREELKKK